MALRRRVRTQHLTSFIPSDTHSHKRNNQFLKLGMPMQKTAFIKIGPQIQLPARGHGTYAHVQ